MDGCGVGDGDGDGDCGGGGCDDGGGRAMFQKFSDKFVKELLFVQYNQLHGTWPGASVPAATGSTSTVDAAKAPLPPPLPQSSLQLPLGGVGEGGSVERLAAVLEAATKCAVVGVVVVVEVLVYCGGGGSRSHVTML